MANILYLVVTKFCDVDLHPNAVPNEQIRLIDPKVTESATLAWMILTPFVNAKVAETQQALADGAHEIDMVVDIGAGNYWSNREYHETQYKIIQSMRVALPVVEQLDLQHDASFMTNKLSAKQPPTSAVRPEDVAEVDAVVAAKEQEIMQV